ncbi:MAG: hypothetical protein AUG06_00745 [Actinobacteria bacterium 13_1_20CM_2_65_11]|nr:MAG: hypothetical protein AUH69_08235 [Actinobacteria bacterium 13_1_40CM_4_65_12]OLE81655.1 MAG: hypothetical protein AUG06_00745 [Actinobacteria bacterium 13_1_20CM_2_65_11]
MQSIAIILRVAADRASEFEAMFAAEEIPIWDDFIARGLFKDCSLTRVTGGGETPEGIQDYILHIVATEEGHTEHDHDGRFKSFLERAQKLQPKQPLVWFGDPIFERR